MEMVVTPSSHPMYECVTAMLQHLSVDLKSTCHRRNVLPTWLSVAIAPMLAVVVAHGRERPQEAHEETHQPPSVSAVRERVEARRDRLKAATWNLTEEGFEGTDSLRLESRRTIRMLTQGTSRRIDMRYEGVASTHNRWSVEGTSGGISRQYGGTSDALQPTQWSGTVSAEGNEQWTRFPYSLPLEIAVLSTDLHLSDMLADTRWSIAVSRTAKGDFKLDLAWKEAALINDFSVTVSPAFDYAISQIIFRGGYAGQPLSLEWTYEVQEWQSTKRGLHVPRRATWSRPARPSVPDSTRTLLQWNVTNIDDITELQPQAALVRFPTGTAVYDGIHNLSFIAGKAVVVADTDGTHYHTSLDAFPFLHDYTDPHTGMTDEQWNASTQKRMVEETWADVVDGKIVPRSARARPVSAAAPAPLATERGYGPTVLLIGALMAGALMAASAAAVVLLRARSKSAA